MADTIEFACPNKDSHIEITNTSEVSTATSHWDGDKELMRNDETIYFISDNDALQAFKEEIDKLKDQE